MSEKDEMDYKIGLETARSTVYAAIINLKNTSSGKNTSEAFDNGYYDYFHDLLKKI